MASGLRSIPNTRHFEIYYEKPWGGVASDADPVDIEPNQLTTQQGVVVVNNALRQFNFPGDPLFAFPTTGGTLPALIFTISGALYCVDQFGGLWFFKKFGSPPPIGWLPFKVAGVQLKSPDYPWAQAPADVQVINGSAYITNPTNTSIYVFDPIGGTFTLGSNYTGGFFLGVLDDYLLQINTNSAVDGLQPNRVNWSGPGKFTTWDPSIDQTAGFNTIAACDDQLTGFSSLTSIGLLYSKKTIIEMSPTGVGIQPFAFTTLWTADIGQGGLYPYTITQWGRRTFGLTDTGAFAVSTSGGFEDISGHARSAILSSLQIANLDSGGVCQPLVAGTIILYGYSTSYPTPFYCLVGIKTSPINQNLVIWMFDLTNNIWTSHILNVDTLVNQQNGTSLSGGQVLYIRSGSFILNNLETVPPTVGVGTPFANSLSLFWLWVLYGSTVYPLIIGPWMYAAGEEDPVNNATNLNLVFRAEEIMVGHTRQPTMRRVVVKAYGSGDLVLAVTDVNGISKSLGTITLDGTTNHKTYYSPSGIGTMECPQLSITSTDFKGVITKVMMTGTFADGLID